MPTWHLWNEAHRVLVRSNPFSKSKADTARETAQWLTSFLPKTRKVGYSIALGSLDDAKLDWGLWRLGGGETPPSQLGRYLGIGRVSLLMRNHHQWKGDEHWISDCHTVVQLAAS